MKNFKDVLFSAVFGLALVSGLVTAEASAQTRVRLGKGVQTIDVTRGSCVVAQVIGSAAVRVRAHNSSLKYSVVGSRSNLNNLSFEAFFKKYRIGGAPVSTSIVAVRDAEALGITAISAKISGPSRSEIRRRIFARRSLPLVTKLQLQLANGEETCELLVTTKARIIDVR